MKITEFKKIREDLDLTQQQVADALETHVQVISQIERGVKEKINKKSFVQERYKEFILNKLK